MLQELILKNRSYRRFDESYKMRMDTLTELIGLARLSASAANLQPLKYIVSSDPVTNEDIFSTLAWAGYLKDWQGPKKGERPSGYIVVLMDKEIAKDSNVDAGIACQSMLLGAVEKGLGGCIVVNMKGDTLRGMLRIPDRCEIICVVALGKPAEKVVIDDLGPEGNIKYHRDEQDVHHVPKRSVNELIIGTYPS